MPDQTDVEVQEVVAPVETQETEITGEESEVAAQEASEGAETQEPNEVAGLREGIEAERKRRQAAEERAKILEQESQSLRQQVPQRQVQKDPLEGLTDEEFVDVRTVKSYVKNVIDDVRNQFDAYKVNQSVQNAMRNHEDYGQVVGMLSQVANQTQMELIAKSNDPAETAYNFVKASPQYINSLTDETVKKTAQQTIETINQHSGRVKTLSNAGGNTKSKAADPYAALSDAEFNEVQNAYKYGNTEILKKYGVPLK